MSTYLVLRQPPGDDNSWQLFVFTRVDDPDRPDLEAIEEQVTANRDMAPGGLENRFAILEVPDGNEPGLELARLIEPE